MFVDNLKCNVKVIHDSLNKDSCDLKIKVVLKDLVLFGDEGKVFLKDFGFTRICEIFAVIRYDVVTELTMTLSDLVITGSSVMHFGDFLFFECLGDFVLGEDGVIINVSILGQVVESVLNSHEVEQAINVFHESKFSLVNCDLA